MWPFNRKGPSGFSSSSTAEDVTQGVDGTGLTAIVTGSDHVFRFLNPPKQSLGSNSKPWSSKSETTLVSPLQAAMWRAVWPSMSLKLTLTPDSNSSLIQSRSPSFAEYINLTSRSIGLPTSSVSFAAATVASCLSDTIKDCFPNVNLRRQ